MTIIVGIASPDGIVLASDSRITSTVGDAHRIRSDSAQKVFAVEGLFGVATSGLAFIGEDTIAGVMDRFLAQLLSGDTQDVDDFAEALGAFFHQVFTDWLDRMGESWEVEKLGFALHFLVSGYDDEGVGHIHEVRIPGPVKGDYSSNTIEGGTMWRGQTDVISRLIKGVDAVGIALSGDPLDEEIVKRLAGLEYSPLNPITVQDALDYADFLIRTTIDMQRFSDGTLARPGLVPGCGGPVQLLIVERDGTSWAQPPIRSVPHDDSGV